MNQKIIYKLVALSICTALVAVHPKTEEGALEK